MICQTDIAPWQGEDLCHGAFFQTADKEVTAMEKEIAVKKKKGLKEWYDIFCDVIEVYIPALIFIFLFVTYAILIVCRYVMRTSIDWMYELNGFAFVWCGILAASYGSRKVSHVQFTILYDHVSPNWQRVMRIVGDLAVTALFIFVFPKALASLKFMAVRKSSILKLRFNYVYAPFLVYMALTALHHLIHVGMDVYDIIRGKESKQ